MVTMSLCYEKEWIRHQKGELETNQSVFYCTPTLFIKSANVWNKLYRTILMNLLKQQFCYTCVLHQSQAVLKQNRVLRPQKLQLKRVQFSRYAKAKIANCLIWLLLFSLQTFHLAVCVPDSCDEADVEILLNTCECSNIAPL